MVQKRILRVLGYSMSMNTRTQHMLGYGVKISAKDTEENIMATGIQH